MEEEKSDSLPPLKYWKLADFLKDVMGINYTTYAKLRAQGRTPKELRLSERLILISESAIREWQEKEESRVI